MRSRLLSAAKTGFLASCLIVAAATPALARDGFFSREQVISYTPEWTGERFPDGRPKVSDDILERMKAVTLEEAWATLRTAGYNYEYEDGWLSIFPEKVLVGRALTAQWMPGRPDIQKVIEAQGKQDQRKGAMNAWPVDMLQKGDVYVADHFGLKKDGPSIGDNVGNAIYARSGNGIVYDGAVRDIGARPRRRCRLHPAPACRKGGQAVRDHAPARYVRPQAPVRGDVQRGSDRHQMDRRDRE
jgi:hypothetical protein